MGAVEVRLDSEVVALLERLDRDVATAVRELVVLELYRTGDVSGGAAAALLHISDEEFRRKAAARGIPYFRFAPDEFQHEVEESGLI